MGPRSRVLLGLPKLAPQGHLSLSLLHVLLGCADGDRVFLTAWEQLHVPPAPRISVPCCACAC